MGNYIPTGKKMKSDFYLTQHIKINPKQIKDKHKTKNYEIVKGKYREKTSGYRIQLCFIG